MKTNYQGFFLFELLLAIFLGFVFFSLVIAYCSRVATQVQEINRNMSCHSDLSMIYSYISQDMKQTINDTAFIKDQNEYVWVTGNNAIGWALKKDGKLVHSIGSYDFNAKKWQKRTKSVIGIGCQTFNIEKEDRKMSVAIHFYNKTECHWSFFLKRKNL